MRYRIVNLYAKTASELIETFGNVVRCAAWRDADCVDVDINPEVAILKINGGNLTIDVGAKLFTIPYEDYASIEIL